MCGAKAKNNIFQELGFSKTKSLALEFKAEIYYKILDLIEKKQIKASDLEELLGIPQPRVSELLNGKIAKTSIEKLLVYLQKLGVKASIQFHKKAV